MARKTSLINFTNPWKVYINIFPVNCVTENGTYFQMLWGSGIYNWSMFDAKTIRLAPNIFRRAQRYKRLGLAIQVLSTFIPQMIESNFLNM